MDPILLFAVSCLSLDVPDLMFVVCCWCHVLLVRTTQVMSLVLIIAGVTTCSLVLMSIMVLDVMGTVSLTSALHFGGYYNAVSHVVVFFSGGYSALIYQAAETEIVIGNQGLAKR